eukprot:1144349-Pelagomonas_calceolata.AAC.10
MQHTGKHPEGIETCFTQAYTNASLQIACCSLTLNTPGPGVLLSLKGLNIARGAVPNEHPAGLALELKIWGPKPGCAELQAGFSDFQSMPNDAFKGKDTRPSIHVEELLLNRERRFDGHSWLAIQDLSGLSCGAMYKNVDHLACEMRCQTYKLAKEQTR